MMMEEEARMKSVSKGVFSGTAIVRKHDWPELDNFRSGVFTAFRMSGVT